MDIRFNLYYGTILNKFIHTFLFMFYSKIFNFNFTRKLLHGFKNVVWRTDRVHRDLQIGCTSNLNPMLTTFIIIQFQLYSIHFYTFSIIKGFIIQFFSKPF